MCPVQNCPYYGGPTSRFCSLHRTMTLSEQRTWTYTWLLEEHAKQRREASRRQREEERLSKLRATPPPPPVGPSECFTLTRCSNSGRLKYICILCNKFSELSHTSSNRHLAKVSAWELYRDAHGLPATEIAVSDFTVLQNHNSKDKYTQRRRNEDARIRSEEVAAKVVAANIPVRPPPAVSSVAACRRKRVNPLRSNHVAFQWYQMLERFLHNEVMRKCSGLRRSNHVVLQWNKFARLLCHEEVTAKMIGVAVEFDLVQANVNGAAEHIAR